MAGRWIRPRRLSLIATCSAASLAALASSSATVAAGSTGGNGYDASIDPLELFIIASHGLLRSSRAIFTFAANSLDYKYSLRRYDFKSDEYHEVRSMVHNRAATRILKLCEANKGFYIKAGQFVASLQHMPKEYVSILAALQDKALPCDFEVVERVLMEEFGSSTMDLYREFDKQPVAAASIAQVHRACLKDGQEVAVKVQYPRLQQHFRIDIATMDLLSRAVAWLFPDYQFQWIVPEFERSSLKELDFQEEAQNAEKTAFLFAKNNYVKVPSIFWDLSSHRVLTMEFVHGFKIDDVEGLKTAGLNPSKVARVLLEAFAQMIFVHGRVHGDPHPGNIFIRHEGNTGNQQFQLVLLDHGLYRELDEGLRVNFCRLWKALVLANPVEAQKVGERLGAGKYVKFLPVIFMGRTLESTSGLGEGMSIEERKKLRDEVRLLTFGDVSQFMEGLPRDLLIVFRTDGLLRSIVSKLGAQPRMRLLINAKHAISGLSLGKSKEADTKWTHGVVKSQLEFVNLRFRLGLLEMYYVVKDLYATILHWLRNLRKRVPQWLMKGSPLSIV